MAKEVSTTELKDKRADLIQRGKDLVEGAKKESRKLNDEEQKQFDSLSLEVREIDLQIMENEVLNRSKHLHHVAPNVQKFSLRKAIKALVDKTEQGEAEAAVIEETRKLHKGVEASFDGIVVPLEARGVYNATDEAATGVVVDEDQQELLLPLESKLVLKQAGARVLTGLVGNISWPEHSAVNVFWEGENAQAKDGSGIFKKGTLFSPKRLTAYVDISKQLLIQENRSVEGVIRNLIAVAIAQKIEQTAFSKEAHAEDVPDGLFQAGVESLGAMSWANVVKMETEADLENALFGNLAYILHPSLVGQAKTKVKDASGAGGFIFGESGVGMLNGYRALRTNNLPKGLGEGTDEFGAIFGNWDHFFLGQWGGIELTVDPYTQATSGMVRLIVNSYWNMGCIRKESFTIASMK